MIRVSETPHQRLVLQLTSHQRHCQRVCGRSKDNAYSLHPKLHSQPSSSHSPINIHSLSPSVARNKTGHQITHVASQSRSIKVHVAATRRVCQYTNLVSRVDGLHVVQYCATQWRDATHCTARLVLRLYDASLMGFFNPNPVLQRSHKLAQLPAMPLAWSTVR